MIVGVYSPFLTRYFAVATITTPWPIPIIRKPHQNPTQPNPNHNSRRNSIPSPTKAKLTYPNTTLLFTPIIRILYYHTTIKRTTIIPRHVLIIQQPTTTHNTDTPNKQQTPLHGTMCLYIIIPYHTIAVPQPKNHGPSLAQTNQPKHKITNANRRKKVKK